MPDPRMWPDGLLASCSGEGDDLAAYPAGLHHASARGFQGGVDQAGARVSASFMAGLATEAGSKHVAPEPARRLIATYDE
jgi:hypothetical protein